MAPTQVLRIGIDFRPALLNSSGIGRAVRELCRAMAGLPELDLQLFAHSLSPARRADALPVGAHLHRLPIPGRSLGLLAGLGLDAGRLCGGVELFHHTDFVYAPVRGPRQALTLHDLAFFAEPGFHGPAQSAVLQARCAAAVAGADLVICPSEASAAMAREHLDLQGKLLQVIRFGVDHLPGEAPPRPREAPYLLMVGTIEPRKNHLRMLEAWRMLPAPRPQLVVIGRPGWRCAAEVAALQAGARDGVQWLESCGDAELFAFLYHAEALCYPSLLEGFGFPPLEALRLGVPVLAGDTPALREVLGDTPEFVAPDDVEAIHAGLQRLLDGVGEPRRATGIAHASTYTWADCAREHCRAYRQLLERVTA